MKRTLLSLFLSFGITAPFLSVPLAAQSTSEVAQIPFAFIVSGKQLPAGEYSVSSFSPGSTAFVLRNTRQASSTFIELGGVDTRKSELPSLQFACYGKECVLAAVTPAQGSTSYHLSRSAIEKNLTHKLSFATLISVRLGAR